MHEIENKPTFAFKEETEDYLINNFKNLFISFLKSKTYNEFIDRASNCYKFIFKTHGKGTFLAPAMDSLRTVELYDKIEYAEFREKLIHQVNVFLLGLYIFHNCKWIRDSIKYIVRKDSKSDRVPAKLRARLGQDKFRYSGGTVLGEFLFRWRITSLCHDIGAITSMEELELSKIQKFLDHYSAISPLNRIRFEKIWDVRYNSNKTLVEEFNNQDTEFDFTGYIKFQTQNPFKGKVQYNHGIFGGLLLYYIIKQLYERKENLSIESHGSGSIFWTHTTLYHQIRDICFSIALHDLDSYEENFLLHTKNPRIYNFYQNPFASLLKLSDLLQEWHKPIAQEVGQDNKIQNNVKIDPEVIDISINKKTGKITVDGLNNTNEKLKEIKEMIQYKIDKFFYPNDFIIFKE